MHRARLCLTMLFREGEAPAEPPFRVHSARTSDFGELSRAAGASPSHGRPPTRAIRQSIALARGRARPGAAGERVSWGIAVSASPPRIESYRFGGITIDGESFTRDVIIRPDGVLARWWRREGHSLCPQDLEGALEARPDCLVIGCGASGALKVPDETRRWIAERGIELVELPTGAACEKYNELSRARRVVAALHLTC